MLLLPGLRFGNRLGSRDTKSVTDLQQLAHVILLKLSALGLLNSCARHVTACMVCFQVKVQATPPGRGHNVSKVGGPRSDDYSPDA